MNIQPFPAQPLWGVKGEIKFKATGSVQTPQAIAVNFFKDGSLQSIELDLPRLAFALGKAFGDDQDLQGPIRRRFSFCLPGAETRFFENYLLAFLKAHPQQVVEAPQILKEQAPLYRPSWRVQRVLNGNTSWLQSWFPDLYREFSGDFFP